MTTLDPTPFTDADDPPRLVITPTGRGTRIELPRRDIPRRRLIGWGITGVGLLVAGFLAFWMAGFFGGIFGFFNAGSASGSGSGGSSAPGGFGWGGVSFIGAFVVMGLTAVVPIVLTLWWPVRIGLLFAHGSTTIEAEETRLVARDHLGPLTFPPFAWTRRIDPAAVEALRVYRAGDRDDRGGDHDASEDAADPLDTDEGNEGNPFAGDRGPLGNIHGLAALLAVPRAAAERKPKRRGRGGQTGGMRQLSSTLGNFVAVGYPAELLRDLAEAIRDSTDIAVLQSPSPPRSAPTDPAATRHAASAPATAAHDFDPASLAEPTDPKAATLKIDEQSAVTISLPRLGFWRVGRGFGCFAVIWLGFVAFWTAFAAATPVSSLLSGQTPQLASVGFAAFSIPFWIVGFFMARYALDLGSRHATIDIIADTLVLTETRRRGPRSIAFTRDQLAAVRVGKSDMSQNDEPILELHVILKKPLSKDEFESAPGTRRRNDRTLALFTERDDDTLRWIAKTVRESLGVPSRPRIDDDDE